MNLTYAQSKRLKSLAKRYYSEYSALVEYKDINEHYHSNFIVFIEKLLVEHCGYKNEDPKPEFYRPRKIGTRPKKRQPGTRPPRIGEKINTPKSTDVALVKSESQVKKGVVPGFKKLESSRPEWEKKAWRKIMMNVHPDRLDSVSKNDMDKLQRMQIGDLVRVNSSPEVLICCSHLLDLSPELSSYEQERTLRVSRTQISKEVEEIQASIPWTWGESFVDNNLRLKVIKLVLQNNNITPPTDEVLLAFISKNNLQ